jgi:hypothetical protein
MIIVTKGGKHTKMSLNSSEPTIQPSDCDSEIVGRLLIVEGDETVKEDLKRRLGLEVAPSFEGHFQDNESLATAELDPENVTAFFARWSATVTQDEAEYNIGKSLRTNKPYDVETINDPKNLHLDHQRYYKWPENLFRSYDPISILRLKGQLLFPRKKRQNLFLRVKRQFPLL